MNTLDKRTTTRRMIIEPTTILIAHSMPGDIEKILRAGLTGGHSLKRVNLLTAWTYEEAMDSATGVRIDGVVSMLNLPHSTLEHMGDKPSGIVLAEGVHEIYNAIRKQRDVGFALLVPDANMREYSSQKGPQIYATFSDESFRADPSGLVDYLASHLAFTRRTN